MKLILEAFNNEEDKTIQLAFKEQLEPAVALAVCISLIEAVIDSYPESDQLKAEEAIYKILSESKEDRHEYVTYIQDDVDKSEDLE